MLEMLLNVEASYMAIGVAARLSLVLGLHRKVDGPDPAEIKERHNTFWALYVFDKIVSLRLGRPPTISDREIEIDEPGSCGLLSHHNTTTASLYFQNLIKLSNIEGEIYSELYSPRCSSSTSWAERIEVVDRLNKKVIEWRDSLPDGVIQPGRPLSCSTYLVPSAVLLHCEYYNCLSTLHRLSSYRGAMITDNELHHEPNTVDLGITSSRIVCISAARDTARILGSLEERSGIIRNNLIRCVWSLYPTKHFYYSLTCPSRVSYYPLSAFLTIFVNILQNPHAPDTSDDLHLLHMIVGSLSSALTISSSTLAMLLLEIFQKVMDIAESFVYRAHFVKSNQDGQGDMLPVSKTTTNTVCDIIHGFLATPIVVPFVSPRFHSLTK